MRNQGNINFNRKYPQVEDLRIKALHRIPRFAFDYLDGGCNQEENLARNTRELQQLMLKPNYLVNYSGAALQTSLFGETYSAPFGVAPMGLQGLMWPGASRILAKAAFNHKLPFILSTVATSPIEEICELTEGKAWFQFYHPASSEVRDDLIARAEAAGCKVLVLLCDVPTHGYRPREIRNGLSMPPRMSMRNILQMLSRPQWALATLMEGTPHFANLKPYMPKGLDLRGLGRFMDELFEKRMTADKIAAIRDRWKGTLVLKGVASEADAALAVKLGLDGIVISNHGGRQLDIGESSIAALQRLAPKYADKLTIMMDSGLRSGTDIARAMACGAQFTFLGRAFMYGTAALGKNGGEHTIAMLKAQLKQTMEQLGCTSPAALSAHL
ncbi:MAG: alpha-hydroxy-acid oxidizing protein [Eudoraea sp.]|nr:alpha-hydroxy-acid oxidizing protein [Eudoraea sp.]NNJ40076.1 alpha-hydroxy-acid oxidizing protein [Eudoraea sp.]